jgi:hypothetical protein
MKTSGRKVFENYEYFQHGFSENVSKRSEVFKQDNAKGRCFDSEAPAKRDIMNSPVCERQTAPQSNRKGRGDSRQAAQIVQTTISDSRRARL